MLFLQGQGSSYNPISSFLSISSQSVLEFSAVFLFFFFDYGSKDIDESRTPYMSILLGKTGDHRQRCIGFIQEYL